MEIRLPDLCLLFVFGEIDQEGISALIQHPKLGYDISIVPAPKFSTLESLVLQRLQEGLFTVIDAQHLSQKERLSLKRITKEYFTPNIALILQSSSSAKHEEKQLHKTLTNEGFRKIHSLDINLSCSISISENRSDKQSLAGPFDIIGDVHGCYDELIELLEKLDYTIEHQSDSLGNFKVNQPEGRKLIFVGDLVDKGPNTPAVLKLVMHLVDAGIAFCVIGNHEAKLLRKLKGSEVTLNHGLLKSVDQLQNEPDTFIKKVIVFIESLPHHLVFDEGRLAVAHAGIQEAMLLRNSGKIKAFCLYGETTGKLDQDGLPERINWARKYSGTAKVVHGHVPKLKAEWLNNVIDIDTGCVYGGNLTCLRYPSLELVAIKAHSNYSNPKNGRNPFKDYTSS